MNYFDSPHLRAAVLVVLLGIGVTIALAPFVTGLVGAPVLYVALAPVYRLLVRWFRPSIAAMLVVLIGVLVIVVPLVGVIMLTANETPGMVNSLLQSPFLGKLRTLHVGGFDVGMQLEQAGAQLLRWIASNAISLLGGVTYTILNLTFALFGLYFLVQAPASAWQSLRPYIPFSDANANRLQERFEAVTMSTLIGTGLAAAAQGLLIALGFMWVGIPNAWFWGVVTVVFAILPVIGSGAIYVPAVIGLVMAERMGAAIFLAAWGTLVVANVDNVIRPLVYKKYAQVHPLVTLVGAIAGVSYFGLLGLLLGPLALSYFFELLRMYRDEYVTPTQPPPPGPPAAPDPPAPTPEPEPA